MERCGHCGAGGGGCPTWYSFTVPYGYTRVREVNDSTNIFIFVANKNIIGKCQSILTIQCVIGAISSVYRRRVRVKH